MRVLSPATVRMEAVSAPSAVTGRHPGDPLALGASHDLSAPRSAAYDAVCAGRPPT